MRQRDHDVDKFARSRCDIREVCRAATSSQATVHLEDSRVCLVTKRYGGLNVEWVEICG